MAAVGDLLVTKAYATATDQLAINVRFWRVTAVTLTPTDQQIADAISAVFAIRMLPVMASGATYYGMALYRRAFVGRSTLNLMATSRQGTGPGAVVGDILPRQVTGLITFRSAGPVAVLKGRLYVPFPGEFDNQSDGHPGALYQGTAQSLADMYKGPTTFTAAGAAGSVQLKGELIPVAAGGGAQDISTAGVAAKWATQRRRGDYGRVNGVPF